MGSIPTKGLFDISPKSRKERSNVLFIMTDQHRYDYLSCAGSEFIDTDNLDGLAARGVRFENCFTTSPVCAPARISLATGMRPFRFGSSDNNSYLPLSATTQYQVFRDRGYRVGCVGKLDLGKPSKYNGRHGDRPWAYSWGFTHPVEIEGKMHAASSPDPRGPYTYYLQEKGLLDRLYSQTSRIKEDATSYLERSCYDSVLPCEDFADVFIGRRACRWLEEIPEDFPWYLFVSFVGPHDPFDPPAEYTQKYLGSSVPSPISDDMSGKPDWIQKRKTRYEDSSEMIAESRQRYAAYVDLIDDQIGAIFDVLKDRGFSDNTYIVFTSDHGEMLGDHGLYIKHVAYEPSMHVPLIISGPGIEGGRTSDVLVEISDLFPTLCELAGLPFPADIDGRSLQPVLHEMKTRHREAVVSSERNYRCIRTDKYKLIENYNDRDELYDLENDPQEINNILADEREIAEKMRERLREEYIVGRLWR